MHLDLYAWVGEDEFGGGEVGLKQALTAAGMIPLAAIRRDKMDREDLIAQLEEQAKAYGKTIRLVHFVSAGIVREIKP